MAAVTTLLCPRSAAAVWPVEGENHAGCRCSTISLPSPLRPSSGSCDVAKTQNSPACHLRGADRRQLHYHFEHQRGRYFCPLVHPQRSATKRINSQTVALGIERPHLRNGQAIDNLNTLIYVLINLRALHRVRQKKGSMVDP